MRLADIETLGVEIRDHHRSDALNHVLETQLLFLQAAQLQLILPRTRLEFGYFLIQQSMTHLQIRKLLRQ